MSRSGKDMTRWNRAGLQEIVYVDGNGISHYEFLRKSLAEKFPHWQELQIAETETDQKKEQRLQEQYQTPSSDMALTLIKGLAQSGHILSEYINQSANEAFIGTAKNWGHVKRISRMIGCQPKPPASASTPLVLTIRAGKQGVVKKGVQLAGQGSDDQRHIFATLSDTTVHADLNCLRPDQWDCNPDKTIGPKTIHLEGNLDSLRQGDPLLLEYTSKPGAESELFALLITGCHNDGEHTVVHVTPRVPAHFSKGHLQVHIQPKDKIRLLGPSSKQSILHSTVLYLQQAMNGKTGDGIFILGQDENGQQHYFFRFIKAIKGKRIVHNGPALGFLSSPMVSLLAKVTLHFNGQNVLEGDYGFLEGRPVRINGKTLLIQQAKVSRTENAHGIWDRTQLHMADGTTFSGEQEIYMPLSPPVTLNPTLEKPESGAPHHLKCATPKKMSPGDLAVLVAGHQLAWGRISTLEKNGAESNIYMSWQDRGGSPYPLKTSLLFSHFSSTVRLVDWQKNNTVLNDRLFPLTTMPDGLKPGRPVILKQQESGKTLFTSIRKIVQTTKGVSLLMAHDFPAGATKGNLLLYGNIGMAGHGEQQSEIILGSGNSAMAHQSFTLEHDDISFINDATFASGVRPDLAIRVAGQPYDLQADLFSSQGGDRHYKVRFTDEGYLRIIFGDGIHGCRLPTGQDSIRVSFRRGHGRTGNMKTHSIDEVVNEHPLVEEIMQPLAAEGGADIESASSLRFRGPQTTLALNRAVSLHDFTVLTARHASIAQARAFRTLSGFRRNEKVLVVVVAEGGATLDLLRHDVRAMLLAHAAPGIDVQVMEYQPLIVAFSLQLHVDPHYLFDEVKTEVIKKIATAYGLENRTLGDPLYISDLYARIESVDGVLSCGCRIRVPDDIGDAVVSRHGDAIVALKATGKQVIHLASPAEIEVSP